MADVHNINEGTDNTADNMSQEKVEATPKVEKKTKRASRTKTKADKAKEAAKVESARPEEAVELKVIQFTDGVGELDLEKVEVRFCHIADIKFEIVRPIEANFFTINGVVYPATHFYVLRTVTGSPVQYHAVTHTFFNKYFRIGNA